MRLNQEERIKIEQLRRQTRDKKQHVRLSVLIMLDEGYTHEVIAISQGIDSDTVGNYKRKYLHQGLEEYLKDNYVAYQGGLATFDWRRFLSSFGGKPKGNYENKASF